MNIDLHLVIGRAICGGLAAAGFGVLFNVSFRTLPWCAASGGLALAVRAVALGWGSSMEAASFIAALAVGVTVQLLPRSVEVSRTTSHVLGCIPMVPGGFAARAILGFFALATQHHAATDETLIRAINDVLRVTFTIGALATGLAIPSLLAWRRGAKHL